jgi:aryl-alcohol dehydrogenase-like predicted oxidoreductase
LEENDGEEGVNYRPLGKTGIEVSEIGFGAWGIGGGLWQGSDDKESLRALHKAADLGVSFIDTALAYGQGHSERLIAVFLKERREKIVVATKIPPKNREWPAKRGVKLREVFPQDYVRECTENSLKNLGVDCLDVQQFHVWNDEWAEESEWQETISQLKEEKKIRFFGISMNDHEPENSLKALATGKVDTVQVIYNIFDQSPEDKLFPFCLQSGIGIIVRVPFDEGSLTGSITPKTEFSSNDFRNKYFRGERKKEVFKRVERLKKLIGEGVHSLPELALRFCLHHDAVSTVIPGMRSVKHVEANCCVSDGRRLGEKLLLELRNHRWQRNFYH